MRHGTLASAGDFLNCQARSTKVKRSPIRSTNAASMRSISVRTSSMFLQSFAARAAISRLLIPADHGIGLDFDQPIRIDEPRNLDHRARRPDLSEELAMHFAGRFPMSDVGEIDPGADHVLEAGARIFQCLGDDLHDGAGLCRRIANGDRFAAGAGRGAAHGYDLADANRPAEADNRLIRAPRRHIQPSALGRYIVHAALLHQSCGRANGPAASSIARATRNSVSSSNGLPISCKPSGVPSLDSPAGTLMPGNPAIFTVTVKMSLRYISNG